MRDVGCSRWALLLASLLSCLWSVRGQSCHGQTWYESQTLDLETLVAANGTVLVLGVLPATDRDACAALCCHHTSGICTMASFQASTGGANDTCHLYNCLPSHLCTLATENGTDTLLTSAPEYKNDSGEQTNVLTAVHGDGTQSKGRKGVLSLETEDLPLKHDNTTVKPRKGVLKEHGVNTVKARKGVENDTVQISTDLFSDDETAANVSSEELSGISSTLVKLEDLTTPRSDLNASEPPSISWSEHPANSSKNVTDEDPSNMTIIMFFNSTSPTDSTSPRKEVQPSIDNQTTVLPSTTRKYTFFVTSLRGSVESGMQVKESQNSEQVSDWQAETGATSMHLVIGLVLGLMLLLTVLGIVAKRIHDSWQRRHYHRMDFLIDGMYHGDN